jgi:hypothetical protein
MIERDAGEPELLNRSQTVPARGGQWNARYQTRLPIICQA